MNFAQEQIYNSDSKNTQEITLSLTKVFCVGKVGLPGILLKRNWQTNEFICRCGSPTHKDSSERLRRCHMTQYHLGWCKLEYHWGYSEGMLQLLHAGYSCKIAAAYPQCTLNGTPTWSSLNGTTLYETCIAGTCIAGWRNQDVYFRWVHEIG